MSVEIFRGNNRTLRVSVVDQAGTAVNITGASIKMSVKRTKADTVYIFQKSSAQASEILITNASGGIFEVYITPANTNTIDPIDYVYDIELTTATGLNYTIVDDTISVKAEVTRP